jgi:endonuclease G
VRSALLGLSMCVALSACGPETLRVDDGPSGPSGALIDGGGAGEPTSAGSRLAAPDAGDASGASAPDGGSTHDTGGDDHSGGLDGSVSDAGSDQKDTLDAGSGDGSVVPSAFDAGGGGADLLDAGPGDGANGSTAFDGGGNGAAPFDAGTGDGANGPGASDAGSDSTGALDAGSGDGSNLSGAFDAGSDWTTIVDAGPGGDSSDPGGFDAGGGASAGLDAGSGSSDSSNPPDAGTNSDTGSTGTLDAGSGSGETLDAGSGSALADSGTPSPEGTDGGDGGALDGGAWPGPGAALSVHTLYGLPSPALVGSPTDWLLLKPQYVAAYDTTKKVPRWVSWQLIVDWLGTAARSSSFRTDSLLPAGTPQAVDADYKYSGFDRGHMCPSADRTASDADNLATFTLTNAVPQTHQSNAGPWETLEAEARTLAQAGQVLTIVAGPIFGVTRQTIGSGVEVPLSTFKVVVVADAVDQPVTSSTRVIAIIVPNTLSVSGNWRNFRVTAREIEAQTGLDFLSDLPREVQDAVETRVDAQ